MTGRTLVFYSGILIVIGAGWGITQPLTKIAVSTGYGYFGLIFWQLVIGAIALAAVSMLRGRGLPLHGSAVKTYLMIAVGGTVIPNTASYQAIAHLPSGVMSVLLSLIPILSFPMALGLGLEKFSGRRVSGLLAGLFGISLLIFPDSSLPDRSVLPWIAVAMIASFCYAFEGNYVARWGTGGVDAIGTILGASVIGAAIMLPLALGSGQFISPFRAWAAPEWALVGSSIAHVSVYAGYVWLIGRTGPVFAVQVSYLVTGFGVLWAMLLLGETYSPYFWASMGLVLAGVFLVQPRQPDGVAPASAIGETER